MRNGLIYASIGIIMVFAITVLIVGCTSNQAGQAARASGGGGGKCPSESALECTGGAQAGDPCQENGNPQKGICTWVWDYSLQKNTCLCR